MPIVCHCTATSKRAFEKAAERLDADGETPVRKMAGLLLLDARAGKTCLGGCHACLPEIRKIVEERREALTATPVQEFDPA